MYFNVAIIGSGPAGIACAIQLRRHGITPVIFEKNEIGGLLRNANFVENYPGYADGITGKELITKFNNHLKKLNISPIFEEVIKVNFTNEIFNIKTDNSTYTSKYLVIASGTVPKKLNIEANNVFYEICELYKHNLTHKKIVIIGSGDAAFDYALNIAENTDAREVVILNRSIKTKCLPLLKQRALENKKINYLENTELNENMEYDYILGAIGREPNDKILRFAQNDVKNLFYIGDVKNGHFRQTTIAVGDGIKAAMEILTR